MTADRLLTKRLDKVEKLVMSLVTGLNSLKEVSYEWLFTLLLHACCLYMNMYCTAIEEIYISIYSLDI